MGQRPQSRRRLPRPRPLAARQTLAVGDLRCPSLPARRRQRAGDLARAGLVQARHVRTLAARRTLPRTACAGTTGHRHRKHLADRLPHGHRMACRAERLPRHGVVERPRLRRRRDRRPAQPALDVPLRPGRAGMAAGNHGPEARAPGDAANGRARPHPGAADRPRAGRGGTRRMADRLRQGRHRLAGGSFLGASERGARRDRIQRRDGRRRQPHRPAAARHLHRPRRRPGAVLQQVQPPRFPLRRGARTGAEAPPGGFPGARHPHRLPARSDVHFVG